MNNFAKYIPQISSIIVAATPLISALIKERSPTSKKIKKIKQYIDLYTLMPNDIAAKKDLAQLLNHETAQAVKHTTRKLNKSNLGAVIVVALAGGGLSYLFARWAIHAPLVWILFAIILFLSIGISIAGIASIYEEPRAKSK